MGAMLELEGVTAGYGGGDILRGLDLTVEEGAVTCIVGPNGAGKSTILRVISGLLRRRLASVLLPVASFAVFAARTILGRGVVHVPHEPSLCPTLTARDHV